MLVVLLHIHNLINYTPDPVCVQIPLLDWFSTCLAQSFSTNVNVAIVIVILILISMLVLILIVTLRAILIVVWDRGGKGEDSRGKKRREERITERGRRDNRTNNSKKLEGSSYN